MNLPTEYQEYPKTYQALVDIKHFISNSQSTESFDWSYAEVLLELVSDIEPTTLSKLTRTQVYLSHFGENCERGSGNFVDFANISKNEIIAVIEANITH
ncbi:MULTISPECIES: hypothetical protein [Vibrio]|uniref:hypothetical protein n=1 Tax=Vibrio TaxID=662 RepID=UPI00078DCFE5|nr:MULTISPECIES: hypothetical protein [Vibrio]BAU70892.1 hypothetical protein [Vibrio sp. 04Ya108]BBM67851.1 hypothetical protein VA249_44970 [Vibrio alfacsensis]BCN27021.1 hypothetical protein VYA_42130 [Vibrio alfacsensis]